MKATFVLGALLGSAIASPHQHGHAEFHQRRNLLQTGTPANATCGCTTYTTYWYGEPTLVPKEPEYSSMKPSSSAIQTPSSSSTPTPTPTPSSSSTPVYQPPPSSYVAPVQSSKAPVAYEAPKSSAAPEKPQAQSNNYGSSNGNSNNNDNKNNNNNDKSGSGSSGSHSPNGNQWAMTYTPYGNGGGCKDRDTIISDIGKINKKGFTSVRTYSTDCHGLEYIGEGIKQNNMKMILGVYINETGIANAWPQVNAIKDWKQWSLVELIVVGNEAIFNGFADASGLAGFIKGAKDVWRGAGYNGPVTTTEPLNKLRESGGALCGVMDAVAANIQPFFNPDVGPSDAGDFVASQLEEVKKVCPGLPAYNLECGWPKQGNANGAATPGSAAQKTAIKSIVEKAGKNTVVFSYENDPWKEPGEWLVEQYFGCLDLF